ncbi:MAG: hypothetical protein AAF936_08575 [Pseudomonadota bacterium]
MTKTPISVRITTTNQPSGPTNDEPQAASNASSSDNLLKGKLHIDAGAAADFAGDADLQAPSDSADDDAITLDINRSQSFLSVAMRRTSPSPFAWPPGNDGAQSADPKLSTLSIPVSRYRATSTKSSIGTPSMRQREAAAKTFGKKSPHYRMTTMNLGPDFQREHFIVHAEKKGYRLAKSEQRLPPITEDSIGAPGVAQDNLLYDEWRALQKGDMTPEDFYGHRSDQTREERIAFALNLGRVLASRLSHDIGPIISNSLNSVSHQVDAHTRALSRMATPQASPIPPVAGDNAESNGPVDGFSDIDTESVMAGLPDSSGRSSAPSIYDRIAAEQMDAQELRDVKLLELYDDPIAEAKVVLWKLLSPSTDDDDNLGGPARLRWSPCQNNEEVTEVVELFDEMCTVNNSLAEARAEFVYDKQNVMSKGALPLLGIPVELRGSKRAIAIRNDAAKEFSEVRAWHTENTAKNILLDIAVFFGNFFTFGLPLLHPRWRNFCKLRVLPSYRLAEIESLANTRLTSVLKEQNRQWAEQWVTEQFAGRDEYGRLKSEVNNAAALTDHYGNWDVKNNELIEEIKAQLELKVKADILSANETEAMKIGAPLDHKNVRMPENEYLYRLDPVFLRDMAKSIVEGVSAGLREAGLPPPTPPRSSSAGLEPPNLKLGTIPSDGAAEQGGSESDGD